MNTVKVRNLEIGTGKPKIIVPIVGVTKEEIIAEAKSFDSIPADAAEWRVDWFEHAFEFTEVEKVLRELREILQNMPLLVTFRTKNEGGEKSMEPDAYAELNLKAAQTGFVDLIDVEIFTGDGIVRKMIDGIHAAGVKVVASNHDFQKNACEIGNHQKTLQDAGHGSGHFKDCRYASVQKRRFDASCRNGRNGDRVCRQTGHHDVHGTDRYNQPSVRRSIRLIYDIRGSEEGISTGTDGCGRSVRGSEPASQRNGIIITSRCPSLRNRNPSCLRNPSHSHCHNHCHCCCLHNGLRNIRCLQIL